MENEIQSVDQIVESHAAANTQTEKKDEGGESNSEKKEGDGAGDSSGEKKEENQDAGKKGEGKKEESAKKEDENKDGEKEDPVLGLLKSLNLDSVDALKAKLAKSEEKPETEEEKQKKEAIYNADLQKFSVENNLMKLDDFAKRTQLSAKQDRDLVFEEFSAEVKDEIKATLKTELEREPTAAEIEERLNQQFGEEYPVDSEKETVKKRAETKLKRDAARIREPQESSFKSVKEKFDSKLKEAAEEDVIRKDFPAYSKTISDTIVSAIPEKLTVFSGKSEEDEISVSIDVPAEERTKLIEDITKEVLDDAANYALFKKSGVEGLKAKIEKQVKAELRERYDEKAKEEIVLASIKVGTKRGSIGAKNSFATNQGKEKDTGGKRTAGQAADEVLESLNKGGGSK